MAKKKAKKRARAKPAKSAGVAIPKRTAKTIRGVSRKTSKISKDMGIVKKELKLIIKQRARKPARRKPKPAKRKPKPAKRKARKPARRKAKKAKPKPAKVQGLSDEEVAHRLVKVYFSEIPRIGFKRSLDLDAVINAYFYTLQRLKNKAKELGSIKKLVLEEEKKLPRETRSEILFEPRQA